MKMRFICATYRLELSRNPEKAIHCWQNGFDTGLSLYEQQSWDEALPYLGSAFEAAEILLTSRAVEPANARELFTQSASLLIDVLGKQDALSRAQNVYWLAVKRLTHEMRLEPQAEAEVALHLEQLHQHSQHPGAWTAKIAVADIDPFRLQQGAATVH